MKIKLPKIKLATLLHAIVLGYTWYWMLVFGSAICFDAFDWTVYIIAVCAYIVIGIIYILTVLLAIYNLPD